MPLSYIAAALCENIKTQAKESDFMNNQEWQVKEFINAYTAAALWSSTDDQGEPLDSGEYEWNTSTLEKLQSYALEAFKVERDLIEAFIDETGTDYTQAGHSFWLSTNGHGSGFFDFTNSPAAMTLDKKCDIYGHYGAIYKGFDLYVGDDGLIYC